MSKLLAPNGNTSNLNDKQYKLVRTPAFKKFFGDWENDPKNSSKVVDENGEPLVVFHGTNEQFNVFNKKGKGNRVLGYFFTTDKDFSENYGESKLYFLNIKKIKNFNSERFDSLNTRQNAENNYWQLEKDKLLEEMYNGVLIDRNDFFADINFVRKDYVAFEPNQIKLADGTNTTFDGTNPDIRFDDGGGVEDKNYINTIRNCLIAQNYSDSAKHIEIYDDELHYKQINKIWSNNRLSIFQMKDLLYEDKKKMEMDLYVYDPPPYILYISK